MAKKKKKQNTGMYIKWILAICIGVALASNGKLLPESNTPVSTPEGVEIPLTTSGKQGQVIVHTGHTLAYDSRNKTPQWVAWELTSEETDGKESRTDLFLPDPNVKKGKVDKDDYYRSGYDRGHMVPAGDMKWSKEAMQESFYMSNICPQDHQLNTGRWNELENKCRTWARKYNKVYIVCGPIYQGKHQEQIGKHQVKVPDAFFKVVLINDARKQVALGFRFENKVAPNPLTDYLVPVDRIEQMTGLDFFSALPDELENRLEMEVVKKLP